MKSNKRIKKILKQMEIVFDFKQDKKTCEKYVKDFACYGYCKYSPEYRLYENDKTVDKDLLYTLFTYPDMYNIEGWGNDAPKNGRKGYFINVIFNKKFFSKYDYELRGMRFLRDLGIK